MTPPSLRTSLLPQKGLLALAKSPVGRLAPVLEMAERPVRACVLDTFDQRILAQDGLLLGSTRGLDLLTREGEILSQPGGAGFVTDLPDGPVKEGLRHLPALRSLCVLAKGEVLQGTLRLEDEAGKTRARLGLRQITMDGRTAVLATLFPLRGYDKATAALRERLAQCGARPLSHDRLCDLLLPDLPMARAEIDITGDATLLEAATAILAAHLPVLAAHAPGIIADLDTEFLHQYRVALRKMRLVALLFRQAWRPDVAAVLKARLAGLMRPTGAQRDLDVLLLDRAGLERLLPPVLQPGLAGLFDLVQAERRAAHDALVTHLQSDAFRGEVAALTRLISRRSSPGKAAERPFLALARALARKPLVLRLDPSVPDEALHALRLQIKTRRYLMDFLGEDSRPLRRLQDELGRFNDLCVQQSRLQGLLSRHPEADPVTAQSVGALIAVLYGQAQVARAEVIARMEESP